MDSFQDDIIVAGDDGTLYRISQGNLARFQVPSTDELYNTVNPLLAGGVTVAVIPNQLGTVRANGNMMCYLLNLASLKKPQDPSKS